MSVYKTEKQEILAFILTNT